MVAEVTKNNDFVRLSEKYSKLSRFQRVFAYIVRFVHNISIKLKSKEKFLGPLGNDEIQKSVKTFIKLFTLTKPGKSILSKYPGEEKLHFFLSNLPLLAGNNSVYDIFGNNKPIF